MGSENPTNSYIYQHLASRYKRAKDEKDRNAEESPYPADIPRVEQATSSVGATEGGDTGEEAKFAEESPYPVDIPKVKQTSSSVAATEGSDTGDNASMNGRQDEDQTTRELKISKVRQEAGTSDIQGDSRGGQSLKIVLYTRGSTGRRDMIPAVLKTKNTQNMDD